ncbi:NAD-P-binding protein [Laetiporus sulphureus 93-53]|uniref:NAD-P-binding protein n=1 Tax=Laetiporus sulphureus 93-53 TaxID=1314785 RepID=A0A165DJW2_9APHY|nr:NAD-P-binding protein [Laetiporus sulphureus 93-53]KZT05044.1 NAD-P-binding protein [Laetiporus sulphureus 93-53]
MTEQQLVWFITGTSSGLGRYLIDSVLARGDRAIATVRHLENFTYPNADKCRLHVIELDVTEDEDNIKKKVSDSLAVWGRIDVLVNNAGYVSKSFVEEGGTKEAIAQFQTNVFGAISVTNAVLPHMRERKAGTVVFVGSRSVWNAHFTTAAFYMASKAAIHTISETLAAELAPFNIRVLLIVPGEFRTPGNGKRPYALNHHVQDYDGAREATIQRLEEHFKHVRGDPAKAMELLVDVVRGEGKAKGRPFPARLLLGDATFKGAKAHCERMKEDMEAWEDVAMDLDFDGCT